jgi:phosphatidylglycerol:prolipoprotein diacylglycerol transferase
MTELPFLSPAWLGVAMVGAIAATLVLPPAWRRWWAVMAAGVGVASLAALVGMVPWLGALKVTAWAMLMMAGFIAAFVAAVPRAKHLGVTERQLANLAMFALVGGVVGARARYVMEPWPEPGAAPRPQAWGEFLAWAADIDSGGMVWYGGAILGAVLVLAYARFQRIRLLPLADLLIAPVLLGLGIGRIGCFFNGCCYGAPTSLPWAVHGGLKGELIHPTQLYETLACLILFVSLWILWRHRRRQGQVLCWGLVGYGVWRFIDEGLRGDTIQGSFWGLFPATTSQVTSLNLVIATVIGAVVMHYRRRRDPTLAKLAEEVPGSVHWAKSLLLNSPVDLPGSVHQAAGAGGEKGRRPEAESGKPEAGRP